MGREEQQNGSCDRAWSDLFLPQLCGNDACAAALEVAAYQPAGGDRGKPTAGWLSGGLYTCFSSL